MLEKNLWKIFQPGNPALLEQESFLELSAPAMFWSWKFLSVLKQKVIAAGWKESGKGRDLNQKSKPSNKKIPIQQNLALQKAGKCAKCLKIEVASKVWPILSPVTLSQETQKQIWGQEDSAWTGMGMAVTPGQVQTIREEKALEKYWEMMGKRGPWLNNAAQRRWKKGVDGICNCGLGTPVDKFSTGDSHVTQGRDICCSTSWIRWTVLE